MQEDVAGGEIGSRNPVEHRRESSRADLRSRLTQRGERHRQQARVLLYEVHWGKAVLPAGPYTITFDRLSGPAIVRNLTGGGVLVMPVTTGQAMNDQPSGLIVTATENERIVRYLNLREANVSLGYRLFTRSERKLVGKVVEPEAVAIRMARK